MDIYETVLKAFRVGCPFIGLDTADPIAAVAKLCAEAGKLAEPPAVILWDCVRGVTSPGGDLGISAKSGAEVVRQSFVDPTEYTHPVSLLSALDKLPERVIIVLRNSQHFIADPTFMQAVANVRDECKATGRMVVLSGVGLIMPAELINDVIQIVEPLPGIDELRGVVASVIESAGVATTEEQVGTASEACLGVTAFAAENIISFAISRSAGLSIDDVWQNKREKINQTPGLRVITPGRFEDIGGVGQFKKFMTGILCGADRPNAVVFLDEIEKSISGSKSDSSGVSQDQLGQLLQWMQDHSATGCILVGPPGAAKSAIAKASGSESGVPTIQLDLGGAMGSLVGESQMKIRTALGVIDAVSGGKTLWLATCNSLTSLPPELRRRFRLGTWFFDLPDSDERKAIWEIYRKRYIIANIPAKMLDCEWTGAEIESCCDIAHRLGCGLAEAAHYIVPILRAAPDAIEALRSGAEGRLLDASNPGVYQRVRKVGGRKFE